MTADAPLWSWQHGSAARVDVEPEAIAFADIDGWHGDDHSEALRALASGTAAKSPQGLDRGEACAYIEANFAPFRVCDTPGLLTAYYEPEVRGSRRSSTRFSIPVYARPPELAPLPADAVSLQADGLTAGVRTADGWAPYFTRREIEQGALAGRGLEILYLDDPLDAYLMHVQGSALVHLVEGGMVRLAFDGKNGHPYTSIGKLLIGMGLLDAKHATLDRLLDVLRSDMAQAQTFLHENKSYIFFREREETAAGPTGSSGSMLVAGRSLAVDPRYHAFGSLIWVAAPELCWEGAPFARLTVAHDTGSAIIGAQRGDLFCGTGAAAQQVAGAVRHEANFVLLRARGEVVPYGL
jgi:membrane-bound lytic murein transglycosylase A